MLPPLTAYLNERFQLTLNVANFASVYAALATAAWIFQIRPSAGSPVVTLDFRTGGSAQNPNASISYSPGSPSYYGEQPAQIVIVCPASALIGVAAGLYYFDFGFILPGADFERVDGGSITFVAGVTIPPAAGSPAPPTGSDDTVQGGANATPSPVPVTLEAAISAANSSAMAAQVAAAGVASSAAAAAASAAASAASALAAEEFASETGGLTPEEVFARVVVVEELTVTALNTLSALSYVQTGPLAMLIVRGSCNLATASSPKFAISGTTVTWNAANAGYSLNPGDDVSIVYSR